MTLEPRPKPVDTKVIEPPDSKEEIPPETAEPKTEEPWNAQNEIPLDIWWLNISWDADEETKTETTSTGDSPQTEEASSEKIVESEPVSDDQPRTISESTDETPETNTEWEDSIAQKSLESPEDTHDLPLSSGEETSSQTESSPEEKVPETPIVEAKNEIEKPGRIHKKKHLSPEKKEKVVEIINNVRTLIARWHIDDARTLIINGLSLEKDNRELNLLMANLYEREHAFEKAEFLLKELAEADPEDTEVLSHLATVLAMQRKFEVSYELYKKVLSLSGETEEVLYTLTHIAAELWMTEDISLYAKSYLKQYPKNPEILWLYSQSQISKADRKWAIETLIKLKNLTPYNQEIVDLISKLVTEDELAGNFSENREK